MEASKLEYSKGQPPEEEYRGPCFAKIEMQFLTDRRVVRPRSLSAKMSKIAIIRLRRYDFSYL